MKTCWDTILFDLDGTLTDPKEGITASVQYALRQFGIEENDMEILCRFIGPPLVDSFQEFYGFSQERAVQAAEKYREYFPEHGIFANIPYEGIHRVLGTLREASKTLMVATSKPQEFAERILNHFELREYFAFVGGSELDGGRGRKDEVIAYVLQENHLTDLQRVVMVGDRRHDVQGAKRCGLECVGVLYGYGDRQELEGAGAVAVVENLSELLQILL